MGAGLEYSTRQLGNATDLFSLLLLWGNGRSLPNKMEELTVLTLHVREYWYCSLVMFTETWLTTAILDMVITLDRFQLRQVDRVAESGKRKGGGLAVFVNDITESHHY